ncbi:MAG: glycosyltransferase family 4 protein [Anaerolineales bacterium]|nr:glycosyltransferase family 4 protein [Anaerolineales bacterium]
MKILVVNYEMNEDSNVLAWQASVVRELANHCEQVIVLTERLGRFSCPPNVKIHLIPRRPWGIPKMLGSLWLMNFTVFDLIRKHGINACFIHMAMEWTYRLFPVLKLHQVPILLWYAHGTVTNRLRLAHACATKIVTSTPEGFRLESNKKIIIGQGVDIDLFNIPSYLPERNDILYVGRVSPRKRVLLLVKLMSTLRMMAPDLPIRLRILGPTLSLQDQIYLDEIQLEIERLGVSDCVEFLGDMPPQKIPACYRSTFLHINVSQTGSMDKTVMEALACGCPVLTSNKAFFNLLLEHPDFLLQSEVLTEIAQKVISIYERRKEYDPGILRNLIVGHHDINSYANKVYKILQGLG